MATKNLCFALSIVVLCVCGSVNTQASEKAVVDIALEVEACNLLTKYLCTLENLHGKGFLVIRRELTENITISGLTDDTKRLFRRLQDACDHAETTLDGIDYVDEDSNDKWGQVLGNDVGQAIGESLEKGDLTPLFLGASKVLQHGAHIEKERNREQRVIIQSYLQLLSRIQFDVNSRRGDLVHEFDINPNLFLIKSVNDRFIKALGENDLPTKVSTLQEICTQFPSFREAQFSLAIELFLTGSFQKSVAILRSLAAEANPLLQRDGFKGRVTAALGRSLLMLGTAEESGGKVEESVKNLEESVTWSKESLAYNCEVAYVCDAIAIGLMKLTQYEEAEKHWNRCIMLQPNNAPFLWTGTQLAAASGKSKQEQLILLRKALRNGWTDVMAIYRCKQLHPALKTNFGMYLLHPQIELGVKRDFWTDDDLYLINRAIFPLSEVQGTAKIWLNCMEPEGEMLTVPFSIPLLSPNEKFIIVDVGRLPKDCGVKIDISYTCNQRPFEESVTQTFYYNIEGNKRCVEHDFFCMGYALAIFDKPNQQSNAVQRAKDAVDYSLRQKPEYLYYLAWMHYEQGEKLVSQQLIEETIQLYERDGYKKDADTLRKEWRTEFEKTLSDKNPFGLGDDE